MEDVTTREGAIPVLANVTVVAVTQTVRGLRTEVAVGPDHGVSTESVANCDNVFTIPKSALGRRWGKLGPEAMRRFDDALRVALGLD